MALEKKKKVSQATEYSMELAEPFGKGDGTPLQYSCLENSMDRGAWSDRAHSYSIG